MNDILPDLLEAVHKQFKKPCSNDKTLQALLSKVDSGKATYETAQEYSIRLGELLSQALTQNVSSDSLPDGRMYYNIANRLFNEVLSDQYDEISDFCSQVQQTLNEAANIGLAVQTAELNQDRIDGIIEKVSNAENFDDVKWMLESPVVNYSQSVVDDSIKANAELQSKVGLQPKITRKAESGACKWCRALAGTFNYPDDVPDDFYRRHENCRCVVTYDPKDGRGTQDAHTKQWTIKSSKSSEMYANNPIHLDESVHGDNSSVEYLKSQRRRNRYEDVTQEYLETKSPPGTVSVDIEITKNLDHQNEIRIAHIVTSIFGGNFRVLKEINQDHVHTPDYIWNGKLWDLKTIHSYKAPDSALRSGKEQIKNNPGGFILNYKGVETMNVLKTTQAIVSRMTESHIVGDVLLFDDGKFIEALRFK